jgi:hypothetical protein
VDLIALSESGDLHQETAIRTCVRRRMEDRGREERSRPCRVGLRPPIPLSPEEEIRGRSGLRFPHRRTSAHA